MASNSSNCPTPELLEPEILAAADSSGPGAALARTIVDGEIVTAVMEDHVGRSVPLYRIAQELGVPRRRVYAVKRRLVREKQASGVLSPSDSDAMRDYILGTYEEVIEACMPLIHTHAAYAAVALNGMDKLWQASGLNDAAPAETEGDGMQDRLRALIEKGRKLSPVLTTKPGLASLDPKDVRQAKADVDEWELGAIETDDSGQESPPSE